MVFILIQDHIMYLVLNEQIFFIVTFVNLEFSFSLKRKILVHYERELPLFQFCENDHLQWSIQDLCWRLISVFIVGKKCNQEHIQKWKMKLFFLCFSFPSILLLLEALHFNCSVGTYPRNFVDSLKDHFACLSLQFCGSDEEL